jgi:DNA-binding transcriptional ArsR family regulator
MIEDGDIIDLVTAEIILSLMNLPKTVHELTEALKFPKATIYRKVKLLKEHKIIEVVGHQVTSARPRAKYRSCIRTYAFQIDRGEFTSEWTFRDGTVRMYKRGVT